MRVRNAIVVMTKISPFFPMVDAHGKDLLDAVQKLVASEQRGDLKVLAQGLSATLNMRKKTWVPSHVYQHKEAPQDYVPIVLEPVSKPVPTAPSAPKADRSKNGLPSSLPAGPSRPQLTKTDSSGRVLEIKDSNGIPARPETSRTASNSLPARPGQPTSSGRSTPTGLHGLPERLPPSGPRADSRTTSSSASASNASNSTSAARQAALDSMNPPRSPATTAGAQAARDRGLSDRDVARNGSSSRITSSSRLREEVDTSKSSAQPSPRNSRDTSPEANRRSRAGSAESAGSRSRGNREKEKEKEKEKDRGDKDRDRDNGRDHSSSSHRSDREKERKDRESERSERRNRTSEKDPDTSASSLPTGPRSSRTEEKEKSRSSSSSSKRHRGDRQDDGKSSDKEREKGKELLPAGPSSTSNGKDRHGNDDKEKGGSTSSVPQKRSLTDRLGGIDSASPSADVGNTVSIRNRIRFPARWSIIILY